MAELRNVQFNTDWAELPLHAYASLRRVHEVAAPYELRVIDAKGRYVALAELHELAPSYDDATAEIAEYQNYLLLVCNARFSK